MSNNYFEDKIMIFTRGSVADPAHLIQFMINVEDRTPAYSETGIPKVIIRKWVGLSGTRLIGLTIRFLAWLIKKHVSKFPPEALR